MPLRELQLADLEVEDAGSFRHVALHGALTRALAASGHRFLVPADGAAASWDRVLFLNLTFFAPDGGADVLCEARIPADVVAHVAWHHLAARALAPSPGEPPSAESLLFGEAIASAFDLYLVGRLLPNAPDSDFIATQVPAMTDAARGAGLDDDAVSALLDDVVARPERAFEDLRELLFDVATSLVAVRDARAADEVLARFAAHRFEPLLHHFELSNWVLFARANGAAPGTADPRVRALDAELRAADDALAALARAWLGDDAP